VSDIIGLNAEVAKAYEGFDPSIHATNPDGSPRLKKGGAFALKRGRKAGGVAAEPHKTSTIRAVQGADSPGAQISNRQAAGMFCGMTVAGLRMLLGDEWEPSSQQEQKALVDGMEEYLNAAGGVEMSPGVGLLFVWGAYSIPRLTMPETKTRLQKLGAWLGGLFRSKK
jgi:hypothetical protein